MSKSVAYKHLVRALSLWPKDRLRPDCQLQDILLARANKTFIPAASASGAPTPAINERAELENANALYSLLDNRYALRYQPRKNLLMRPASNPDHYNDIIEEIDAAPSRGMWGRIRNRLSGLLRFS
ncbi:hypothetical protein GMDG_07853 [Pseudogymnoascus destructans 20631-21]|uniref:Uncharacterized protein n=2 Tax=Pseudogymnoascus destructans TaxID=655981 RepID=L8G0F4_PSED2|nr:hypothetical protein GMDG_07853 [Pseudogymnoascus destructans 20631-21]